MKSEDDPEARIRDLERPLAEAARASEAGANATPSKWAPPTGPPLPSPAVPMAPPPPPYGGSFLGPSRGALGGGQIRWIILGVFVFGMIALPIAIFSFTAHQVSRGGLTTFLPAPSIATESPTASGTMPQTTTAAGPSTSLTSVTTAPAGQSLTVSGINEVRTIACNGGSVNVSGIANEVVITGHCKALTVSGVRNKVKVAAADSIQASGFNNQITYQAGSPQIDQSGQGNAIQKG